MEVESEIKQQLQRLLCSPFHNDLSCYAMGGVGFL